MKDQDFNWAEFQDLSSAPATIEAAKVCDALGCLPGYKVKSNDAHGAYTQAYLKQEGKRTWLHLPRERWPKSWIGKYTNPVVPLVLALYGHPEAGGALGSPLHQQVVASRIRWSRRVAERLLEHKGEGSADRLRR